MTTEGWCSLWITRVPSRDAGTGGAGGAAAPLAFCWEGQGGQKCPLSIKNIITVSFQGVLISNVTAGAMLKAAFQLSVFHTYVHARKCLNSSK